MVKPHGCNSGLNHSNTLKQLLCIPKDKDLAKKEEVSGAVYKMTCEVGQTVAAGIHTLVTLQEHSNART